MSALDACTTTREHALMAVRRPHLRGRLHLIWAVVSLGGLGWLVRSAFSGPARLAAWTYGVSCVLLYGASATYHVFARSERAQRLMQSIDHSMIYVLIAGTFTPVCLLVMTAPLNKLVLIGVWLAAALGAVRALVARHRFRRWGAALYLVMGWAGVVTIPALIDEPSRLALSLAGGVLYTVGAVLFAMRRPRLWPRWFGYHEVWHVFGVIAGAMFFVVNLGFIRGP
jgi:hemolysin III